MPPTFPNTLLILGTDLAGKDHFANVVSDAAADAGLRVERRRGSIVAISSTLSRQPAPGYGAHTTAKSGLDGFVKSLALELAPQGIRVNVVAPGLTETDATAHIPGEVKAMMAEHIPMRRCSVPDDIARVVAFLASDLSGYLTGAYLPASGGHLML